MCGVLHQWSPDSTSHHGKGEEEATFFTNLELEMLMRSYGEFQHVFRKKCNTAAAAKERETAWENIAARVNAKADARKTGGGPAAPPLTQAEELALSQYLGRPVAEGIPGGSSSSESSPQVLLDGSDRFMSRENDKHG
ncbi:hypothetical protein N1851_013368 [Merluccius polli]|uniref:Myb/SANT-like DNA-binding domain-containing protein n=1 Tax=Merluccius polli TaxID=89951 RepID=A0AA47P3Q3_MERPO|nr:hypothetical protein N1851_013368 [Merluccius polli]